MKPSLRFWSLIGHESAQFWHQPAWVDIDATAMESLREKTKRSGRRFSYVALIARAIATALQEMRTTYPELNGAYVSLPLRFVYFNRVRIAVAAQSMAHGEPFVHLHMVDDANEKSVERLQTELEAVQKTSDDIWWFLALPRFVIAMIRWVVRRSARLLFEHEGSIGLTSLGIYGTHFLPLMPRNMQFAFGPVEDKPVVRAGTVCAGRILTLYLTIDHRAMAGGPPAILLRKIHDYLASPPSEWFENTPIAANHSSPAEKS